MKSIRSGAIRDRTATVATPMPRPTTSCRSTASTTSSSTSATPRRPPTSTCTPSASSEVAYAGLETGVRDRASHVLEQGRIRLVLTGALAPGPRDRRATTPRHGDGVQGDRARRSPTSTHAYREAIAARRARASREPHDDRATSTARVRLATIATYGDTLHTFVDRARLQGRRSCPASRAREPRAPATPACSRSTTSSATSSSATWTSGSATTRTSSG